MSEHSLPETDVLNNVHENSNFIAPTSISEIPQSHSNLSNNDLVINIENESLVGSGIPKTFFVNTSLIGTNLGPYDKYKFPRIDSPLSKAGMMEIPKIDSLEYLVNLFAGKLDPELKQEWDELSGRDTSVPEISPNGMQLTQYDIRHQCALYKKARDKESYVHHLSDKFSPRNSDNQTNGGSLPTQSHPVEIFSSELIHTNVLKLRAPTEGLLYDFLLKCGYDQQEFSKKLLSLVINEQRIELLALLNQIEKHLVYKKHKKKLNKFKLLIEKGKKISQFKINYYIRFISRTVQQRGKVSTIRIKA